MIKNLLFFFLFHFVMIICSQDLLSADMDEAQLSEL